jgi:hypothetical protein
MEEASRARAEGARMSLEDAVAYALDEGAEPPDRLST